MHPVCKRLFQLKKDLISQGSISELEKTVAGGRDLSSLLSAYYRRRASLLAEHGAVARNYEIEDADRMNDEMVIATMRCDACSMANLKLLDAGLGLAHGHHQLYRTRGTGDHRWRAVTVAMPNG